jgi:hypothetical protein
MTPSKAPLLRIQVLTSTRTFYLSAV